MKLRTLDTIFALGRPLSSVYSLVMSLRQKAYQRNIFKTRTAGCPVVSVGNLCMGGTGKTPHVIALARRLADMGLRPAVVSRGYGGKAGRGPFVVSDGVKCLADSTISGDEPYMMAEDLPGVPVITGKDRFGCAEAAISRFGSNILILDDGFQHLSLYRGTDIVLMPAAAPLGTGRVFPGGDLRESPEEIRRASAVILSKCEQVPFNSLDLIRNQLRETCGSIPIFLSRTVFKGIRLAADKKFLTGQFPSPVYCFCAIAYPRPFVSLIERQGMAIAGMEFFRDHQPYEKRKLARIFKNAGADRAELVLTTAKDFARLAKTWRRNFMGRAGIPQLGIVEISAEPDSSFWKFLRNRPEISQMVSRSDRGDVESN